MSGSRSPASSPGRSARRPVRKRAAVTPANLMDRAVIDLLAKAEVPMSAYELTAGLRERGRPMAAMSVYRSLERLCSCEVVEKVEKLAAYRIKDVPKAVLTICVSCGRTRPLAIPDLHGALEQRVAEAGFYAFSVALEIAGRCAECGSSILRDAAARPTSADDGARS